VWGVKVTAIAKALGYWGKFGSLEAQLLSESLDIATLTHMTIIDTKGDINKYPHYKQVLFTFLDVAYTTILNKQNWNCDWVIVREVVIPHEGDEHELGDEEDSKDDDMRVKKKGKRPNNIGNLKGSMTPHLNLNHNHKPDTHILRRGLFLHSPHAF